MMPYEPLQEIMRRTMYNLAFVERHAVKSGPFEVTQLINSFLGALAHPWEQLKTELLSMPLAEAEGWPKLHKERPGDYEPTSLGDVIRLLRNGIAHGNVEFLPGKHGDIKALRVWNINNQGQRNWGTILTVRNLRRFLDQFVRLAEKLARQESESSCAHSVA